MKSLEKIAGIQITHPDKVLFIKPIIRKLEIAQYYNTVSKYILPFLKNRPVTLQRFPQGIQKPGFFQKNTPKQLPDFCHTITVKNRSKSGTTDYLMCQNKKTLLYCAQLNAITFHIGLCSKPHINYADRLVFDLDPVDIKKFSTVIKGAKILKKMLEDFQLASYVMTTGSKGLHIVAPLKPHYTFEQTRSFAHTLAQELEAQESELFTTEIRIQKRAKKTFIDVARNAYAQTQVCPYSIRPLKNAPIAIPLAWEELSSQLNPQFYTLHNIEHRLKKNNKAWENFFNDKNTIPL